eukprot:551618-Pyramimonas_sp.AAC.2
MASSEDTIENDRPPTMSVSSTEAEDISLTLSASGDDASDMSESACELRPASEPADFVLQEPSDEAVSGDESVSQAEQTDADSSSQAHETNYHLKQQVSWLQKELADTRSELSRTKTVLSTAVENKEQLQVTFNPIGE